MKMTSGTRIIILLLILAWLGESSADNITCSENHIRCPEDDSVDCIPLSAICNGKQDCGSGMEESEYFCKFFLDRHDGLRECGYHKVMCTKFEVKTCMTPVEYCQQELPCQGTLDYRICLALKSGQLAYVYNFPSGKEPVLTNVDDSEHTGFEFLAMVPMTLSNEDCPQFYTKVGEECLSFLHPTNVTWGEARAMCQTMGGDLISFRDINHYSRIKMHLKDSMQTNDFWIGGRYLSRTENIGWTWVTGELMPLGGPMWAERYSEECQTRNVTSLLTNVTKLVENGVCYHYVQAPHEVNLHSEDVQQQLCVALTYEHHYSLSDENCLLKKSTICVANQST